MQPVFWLDEPHYHRVRPGEVHRFRGFALAVEGDAIDTLTAGSHEVVVNVQSPDGAAFVNHPRAQTCRFDFEMRIDGPFQFRANGETLFFYTMPQQSLPDIDAIPTPPAEIITVTQGGGDIESYRDSILSGLTTMKTLLDHDPRDILDIGCGTGRLLIGWWAEDQGRRLAGADINPDLIRWDRENLPRVANWQVCGLEPPLPLPDASFDLIQLVSVFTHLTLPRQRAWVEEIRRLLRPGGTAIITLHGEIYAALLLDDTLRQQFELDGHVSVARGAEGENAFGSFHTPRFARELFYDFEVAFYERGPRDVFPIASLQDVYVLRKR